jgi:hypothetical protein
MTQVTRKEIFAQAAKKLRADFEEVKATVLHGGLKGGEAEDLVRKFLQGHLPKRFDAGSGLVIDPHDQLSKQMDVIIYDALNCPVYRTSEKAATRRKCVMRLRTRARSKLSPRRRAIVLWRSQSESPT